MSDKISEEDVKKLVSEVKHPSIDSTLKELGMIKDLSLEGKTATVTVAFPVPNIPIKDDILNQIKEVIEEAGYDFDFEESLMNDAEKKEFLRKEQNNWKGE